MAIQTNIDLFRRSFPEFQDTTKYPNEMVTFWATIAEAQVRKCAWGAMWSQGVQLYIAHECVMAAQNVKAAKVGGAPGQQGGIANSKTVGSVSVAYDSQANSEKDAGWWNKTTYGQQFFRLRGIAGAGVIQL
jgi:hypothetical protein